MSAIRFITGVMFAFALLFFCWFLISMGVTEGNIMAFMCGHLGMNIEQLVFNYRTGK